MAGGALTITTPMTCPHGGLVTVVSTNARVAAGGVPLALATDTFTIAACPFVIGIVPSPCIRVQWIVTDLRSSVGGQPTLSSSSVGLCLAGTQAPQGPVVISGPSPQVSTQ